MKEVLKAFEGALSKRKFGESTTAFRLVNAEGDGVPSVCVDWFNGVAVFSLYDTWPSEKERQYIEAMAAVFQPKAIYLKRRPVEARESVKLPPDEIAPKMPVWGSQVPWVEVLENGLRFAIRPDNGLSVGLYLDARDARKWLSTQVAGKTVLNCFSYTCGFGVAAMAAGARRAVNVDASRKVLDWGEENAKLNGQAVVRTDYISGDVFDWLGRFSKKKEVFDVVVLDPPSFSNTRHSRFSASKDYSRLVHGAAPVVAPGGILMACCNLSTLTAARFKQDVFDAARKAGRQPSVMAEFGASPVDFPVPRAEKSALKVLAVALN